MGGTPPYTWLG